MKPIHFQKKYNLLQGTKFNHKKFGVDFAQEFFSRLETYKQFSSWCEPKYWVLIDEMQSFWGNIDNKTVGVLPQGIWNYLYATVFMPQWEQEFPERVEYQKHLRTLNISQLKTLIKENLPRDSYHWPWEFDGVEVFWVSRPGDFSSMLLGDLPLSYSREFKKFNSYFETNGTWQEQYAWDELVHQLKKFAAAKAKIQYSKEKERRENQKQYDFWDWVGNNLHNTELLIVEYACHFKELELQIESADEQAVKTQFRKLSLIHHPDKNGDKQKFIDIVFAKNKCIEYLQNK